MGIFADLIANAKTFDPNGKLAKRLQALPVDPDLPAAFDAEDAAHTILAYTGTVAAGTFTITIVLPSGQRVTTDPIAFDAAEATIEAAIDAAATAAGVPDWTDGDISVAAETTDLTDGDVVLTFDGDSVAGTNPFLTEIDDSGLQIAGTGIAQTTAGNGTDTAEVQTLSQYVNTPTGGTFKLSFSLLGDGPVTIAFDVEDIPYDTTAAALETLIDAAAVAAGYATWSGEIAVTAETTDLTDGDLILTYGNGLLVNFGNHALATVDWSGLTWDLLDADPVTKTAEGQTQRLAWAALSALGILATTDPPEQQSPTQPTAGANLLGIKPWMVQELAQEAAAEDQNNETYFLICDAALGTEHRKSTLVQPV